jgi:2-oxoacid:acceptor oxidoreductase delta subunit (pyruvate/2-ketoisovalerate family)
MSVKKRSELAKEYKFKTWRDFTVMNTSVSTMLHNLTGNWRFIKPIYEDKIPACQNACPAGNDIESWIRLLKREEYERAYWHLKREQPFPAILGRVCFKFCETACNRSFLDESVSINELERFIGDQVASSTPHPNLPEYNGKTLAVVGSGPAGMSASYYGRLLGFQVTLFEELPEMGGVLRVGIPSYRLPKEIVSQEFEGLKNMGVSLRPNTFVGRDILFKELCKEYDYVFLSTGGHGSKKLDIENEQKNPRIMSGLSFLKKVALGKTVDFGRKVIVIGGGNTAIDAARTAIRLGSDVTLIYRRSEEEMPAHLEEVRAAREEGVKFRFLASPERIELKEDGAIKKVVFAEMELGPVDENGRRKPLKKEGFFFDVKADTLLTAIGEVPIFDYLDGIVEIKNKMISINEGLRVRIKSEQNAKIFAGGDIVDLPHTVVHAVASGKKTAITMDCDRRGLDFAEVSKEIAIGDGLAISFSKYMGWDAINSVHQNIREVVDSKKMVFDYFRKVPRIQKEFQNPKLRNRSFAPYHLTFTNEKAQMEVERCLHCGRCTECDNCLVFCPDMSVLYKGDRDFGYAFDYDYCKGCGVCFVECPRYAITMAEEKTPIHKEGEI